MNKLKPSFPGENMPFKPEKPMTTISGWISVCKNKHMFSKKQGHTPNTKSMI